MIGLGDGQFGHLRFRLCRKANVLVNCDRERLIPRRQERIEIIADLQRPLVMKIELWVVKRVKMTSKIIHPEEPHSIVILIL